MSENKNEHDSVEAVGFSEVLSEFDQDRLQRVCYDYMQLISGSPIIGRFVSWGEAKMLAEKVAALKVSTDNNKDS